MLSFVGRRLVQAVFTLFGVMLLTFALFHLIAGDVSARFVNPKLGKEARVAWLRKNKLDLPLLVNLRRSVVFTDKTDGDGTFSVQEGAHGRVVAVMRLETPASEEESNAAGAKTPKSPNVLVSRPVHLLSEQTPLAEITDGDPWVVLPKEPHKGPTSASRTTQPSTAPAVDPPVLRFRFRDGTALTVDLSALSRATGKAAEPRTNATCGDLLWLIDQLPAARGRLAVRGAGCSADRA